MQYTVLFDGPSSLKRLKKQTFAQHATKGGKSPYGRFTGFGSGLRVIWVHGSV